MTNIKTEKEKLYEEFEKEILMYQSMEDDYLPLEGKELEKAKRTLKRAAINTRKKREKENKRKQISLRIPVKDLEKIKEISKNSNMKYQSWIVSNLHRLVEKDDTLKGS